jgi:hypothetical protein
MSGAVITRPKSDVTYDLWDVADGVEGLMQTSTAQTVLRKMREGNPPDSIDLDLAVKNVMNLHMSTLRFKNALLQLVPSGDRQELAEVVRYLYVVRLGL